MAVQAGGRQEGFTELVAALGHDAQVAAFISYLYGQSWFFADPARGDAPLSLPAVSKESPPPSSGRTAMTLVQRYPREVPCLRACCG